MSSIKQRLQKWLVGNALKSNKRKRDFHNLLTAKSVGIIFDASEKRDYVIVKSFMAEMAKYGAKVSALGFVSQKEKLNTFNAENGIDFFIASQLNFVGKPKDNTNVEKFCKRDFDLFINLFITKIDVTHYIAALSQAKWKLGAEQLHQNLYDMIINLKPQTSLSDYTEYIMYYLNAFKKQTA